MCGNGSSAGFTHHAVTSSLEFLRLRMYTSLPYFQLPHDSNITCRSSIVFSLPVDSSCFGSMPAQNTNMSDHRKNSKPIMEKRRRARINQYLSELKTLILEATKKDPARHTKLEKADILEMTVRHLHNVQRQQVTAISNDPSVWNKFRSGFCECANEVRRYLGRMEGLDSGVKQRLLNYLNICINSMNSMPSPDLSTFIPSLGGIMPQFHPLAMQLAASFQSLNKTNFNMSESQAVEAGKMFGMALLQGRLGAPESWKNTQGLLSTSIPEDLSNKSSISISPLSVQSDKLPESPSYRLSLDSLSSPKTDTRNSSSDFCFKSPSNSVSTGSEKEFSPRKINLDSSPTQLTFKFPSTGHNIQKPIAKHASSNFSRNSLSNVYSLSASTSSSAECLNSSDNGSDDESVWRPW